MKFSYVLVMFGGLCLRDARSLASPAASPPITVVSGAEASNGNWIMAQNKRSGWSWLGDVFSGSKKTNSASTPNVARQPVGPVALEDLPLDTIKGGLKEALHKGLQMAVSRLGQTNGFLTNLNVRIPMPEKLAQAEKLLRTLKQDQLADNFIATMNRAAEQAVPVAAPIFTDAIKQMTIQDAMNIINSTNNAATEFFRRTTDAQLREKFHPIVQQATAAVGVTSSYKLMLDKAQFASRFMDLQSLDLDNYVTGKALDGLFILVAEEEKRIRENPAARTTELLRKVFGAFKK